MNNLDIKNFNNFLKYIKDAFDKYYKSGYYCEYYCPDNEGCKKELKDFSKIKTKDYFTSEFKFDTSLKLKWCNEDYMYLYYDNIKNIYRFEGCSLSDDYDEQFETFDEFYKYMTELFEDNMDLCVLNLSDYYKENNMNNLNLDKLFSKYNDIESFDLDKNKQYTFSIMLGEDPEILTNILDDTDAMKKQIYSYYPKLAKYTIKNIDSAFYMHDAWYVFEIYPKLSYIELKNILGEHDYSYFIID